MRKKKNTKKEKHREAEGRTEKVKRHRKKYIKEGQLLVKRTGDEANIWIYKCFCNAQGP